MSPSSTDATALTPSVKTVQLHSHDFEWEDLARECRYEESKRSNAANSHAISNATSNDTNDTLEDAHELATLAKLKWDIFHQKNNGKVYKPRNYLVHEFPELLATDRDVVHLLELGCGYGSAVFPILATCPRVHAQVCDFSAHAIAILQQNARFDATRCRAFVCDIVHDELVGVAPASIDVALLVFVLSALPPAAFASTLRKVFDALRPGGVVCFRDYGLYDLAMRRNAKQLAHSLYYRSDGTLAYFFSTDDVEDLFVRQCGFQMLENEYCTVRLVNRKKNVTMDRVWLHAKFQKPL